MSHRNKVILTSIFVLFDIVLLICIVSIRNATMENKLKKEMNELVTLDFTKDRFNTKIKTNGSYSKVENAIKTYLDEYALLVQEVIEEMHDEKLTKVLSFDNYQADGPEFKESLAYIGKAKKEFNTDVDKLIADSDSSNIIKYGESKLKRKKYLELYKSLMLNKSMTNNFKETKTTLEESKVRVNNVYDTSEKVLNFLVKNKANWKLEKGQIKFKTEALYKEYTKMIKELNSK